MARVATITSKRQLTIPARLFKASGFTEGQRVLITRKNNALIIEPATDIVDKLAGSVMVPISLRKLSTGQLIERGKRLHFSKRKK